MRDFLFSSHTNLITGDNSTAVAYFNKIGDTHSTEIRNLALEIWHELCSLDYSPVR